MRTAIALALLAVLLSPVLAEDAGRARVSGTDISLVPPRDFRAARNFTGFENPQAEASITVSELPAGIGQFMVGLTDERLKAKGMTVVSRERVEVDRRQGLLLGLTQSAGERAFRKWMLVFGDARQTTLVVATFPKEREGHLASAMKDSILTAKGGARSEAAEEGPAAPEEPSTEAKQLEGVPFRVTPVAPLSLAKVIQKTILLTRGGTFPIAEPGDPIFLVGRSLATVSVTDQKQYAQDRLKATVGVKEIEVEKIAEVTLDGLPGFEIVARAKHDPSGTPLLLYQVMLFTEDAYFLMQGVGLLNADPGFLDPFRKTAMSFKR